MEFIKRLIGHELVSGSFYIFLGSMVANVLAFLLNLFLARNLSYVDYGIFASLLSIVALASIPSTAINNVIVKFATTYYSKNELNKVSNFYFYSFKVVFLMSILIIIIFSLSAPLLNEYLHLGNIFYIILTAVTVASFYLFALNNAFLQSLMKFGFMALIGSLGGLIKLVVGIVLVYLGFRAFSGLLAVFSMTMGAFLISFIPLRKIIKGYFSEKIKMPTKEIIKYSFPVLMSGLFLTSFTSSDIILVKHFFSSHDAGFYAGLSLIGRAIFYFTAPIPMVMFPLLVKRHTLNQSYKKLFYLALILVLLPSFAITIFYFIRPALVINLFLGGRDYLFISKYLGIFGFYLTIFSIVNVFVSFFLSLNKMNVFIPVIAAALLQIVLIYIYHSTFYQVIGVSILSCFLLLIFLLSYFFKNFVVQSKSSG